MTPEQTLTQKWSHMPLEQRLTFFDSLPPVEQRELFVNWTGMSTRLALVRRNPKLLKLLEARIQSSIFALLSRQEQEELLDNGFKLSKTIDPFYILPESTQMIFLRNCLSPHFFSELENGVRFELWSKFSKSEKELMRTRNKYLLVPVSLFND